jgi:heavy metal sensor kinase
MRLVPRSVRARLTFWHAGALTLIICIFSAGIFLFVSAWLYHDLDVQLGRDLAIVERIYHEEPGDFAELEPRAGIAFFQVVENDKVLYQTRGWERGEFRSTLTDGSARAPQSWISSEGRSYRVGTVSRPSYHIAVAREENAVQQTLWSLRIILMIGIPCAVGLAIAGGYFLAGRVLSPIGAMAETARKITAESLGERLPVENPEDEFGRLATVFNATLARVHESFEQLRRFTADASHELRTPLTAMRSVGEVALQDSLDPAAYRDVIGSMLEEVDRLTRLVESLLTLTRAESGRIQLTCITVDLSALAASVADSLRVLAEEKEQSLSVDAPAPIWAECDPAILRQALMNLFHNAIKYTPDKGAIRVAVKMIRPGEAAIEVKDTGPGIPATHRERIFERFYRVDGGRSRNSGGVGLGLAIAHWAVEANGGRIELESEEEQGSLFRVVLSIPAYEVMARGARSQAQTGS